MTVQENIDDYARITDGATLVIQRWLPGPVNRIWRYLTDDDMRSKWLASGDMQLQPGTPLELVWRNDRLSHDGDARPERFDEEERMQSQVIAVDPMRSLKIAWGQGDVTFELKEQGDRVLLTLTHRGLNDPRIRTMVSAGWHMHLDILGAISAGQAAPSFWSGWVRLRDEYASRQ